MGSQGEIQAMADALLKAMRRGSPSAIVSGDPTEAKYFEGRIIDGVLLDGQFDIILVARILVEEEGWRRTPDS
jgi:hypothetical protein